MDNFYLGFEGEPEIRVVLAGETGPMKTIRLWAGHLDEIMLQIEPEAGRWTGLALPYHLNEGGAAGSPWKVPNLEEVIAQWQNVDAGRLSTNCREVHGAVLGLMREAVRSGQHVWISEE